MATDELWCYCHMAIVIRAEELENTTQPLKVGISFAFEAQRESFTYICPKSEVVRCGWVDSDDFPL